MALVKPGLREGRSSATPRAVMSGVGRGFLDGSKSPETRARGSVLSDLLTRVDLLPGGLPASARSALCRLLALLAGAPGQRSLGGLEADWGGASTAELHAALQSTRSSRVRLRRQADDAEHDFTRSALDGGMVNKPARRPAERRGRAVALA